MGELQKTGVQLVAQDADKFQRDMNAAKGAVISMGPAGTKAAGGIGQLGNSFQSLLRGDIQGTMSSIAGSLGSVGAVALPLIGIVATLGAALYKQFEAARALVGEIDDLGDKFGMATQESGALINISKIMGVSTGVLTMAFRTMSRQGIDPSLDGLLEIKRRLDATTSPAERTALAVKLLGRSGLELNETLSLTNKELKNFISTSRTWSIITGQMTDKLDAHNREMGEYKLISEQANAVIILTGGSLIDNVKEWWAQTNATMAARGALLAYGADVRAVAGMSLPELTAEMERLQKITGNVGTEAHGMARDFITAVEDIGEEIETALPDIPSIWDQAFPSPADLARKLQGQIDFIQAGGPGLVAAYNNILSGLAEGAITPEQAEEMLEPLSAAAAGLDVTLGNTTMWSAARDRAEELGIPFSEAREDIEAGVLAIATLPQEIDIRINWIMENPIPGYQRGGSFMVGGRSGADQNIVAFRATRGERIDITPAGSTSYDSHDVMGGKTVIFSPTISREVDGMDLLESMKEAVGRS